MSRSGSNFERDDSSHKHEGESSNPGIESGPDDSVSAASISPENPLLPNNVFETLRKAILPTQEIYKNVVDQVILPHAAAAEAMRNAVMPSAKIYQNVMDQIAAPHAAAAEAMRKVLLPPQQLYKNVLDQITVPHAAAAEAMRNAAMPSEKIYQNVMDQMALPDLRETLLGLEAALSSRQNNILHTLSAQYLWDSSTEAAVDADELDAIDEEELQEQFGEKDEPWSDPVHTGFIQSAARTGRWLQETYPTLKQKTIQAISKYVTLYLYYFIPQLTLYLATNYGVEGLMVASAIAAGAGMITPREKKAIDRDIGLAKQCDFCGAEPDDPCVTKNGKTPGALAKNMHKPRME